MNHFLSTDLLSHARLDLQNMATFGNELLKLGHKFSE